MAAYNPRTIGIDGLIAKFQDLQRQIDAIRSASTSPVKRGAGSPENVRVGSPGDLYVDTDGGAGTTLYVKESGVATDTGWEAK